MGLRDRLQSAPLVVLFIYFTVVFGGITYLIDRGQSSHSWGGAVVEGFTFGVVMTAMSAIMRRRDGKAAGDVTVTRDPRVVRALRTGAPPADRSRDHELLGLIRRRRRQQAWASRVGPWFFGALALLSVCLGFADWPMFVLAGVFVAFSVWMIFTSRRQAARWNNLESELRART